MKKSIIYLIIILICFFNSKLNAQWSEVGEIGFSDGTAQYTSLEIIDNVLYAVYKDGANSNKATVKKFNGIDWETVGLSGFSNTVGPSIDLAVFNNQLYIAYIDNDNSGMPDIMRFNGSSWETVQSPTTSRVQYINLVKDNNYLYVSYKDFSNSFKATVKRYDENNWTKIGNNDISTGDVFDLNLFIHNHIPYVAYEDADNDYKATVMKLNGSNWEAVGTKGFSTGTVGYTKLSVFKDELYIAFRDHSNSSKVSIMKFNGSNWVTNTTLNENTCSYIDLKNNDDYMLIFYSAENGNFGTVKKYDGVNWETVDETTFPNGYMGHCDLNIDNNSNTVYATFSGISGGKIGVVKNSSVLSNTSFNLSKNIIEIIPNPVSDMLYFKNKNNINFKIRVFQIDNKLLLTKLNPSMIDVSKFKNGVYLVEVTDIETNRKINKRVVIANN